MGDREIPDNHFALFWRPRIWVRDDWKQSLPISSTDPLSIYVFSSYEEAVKHARGLLGRAHLEEAIIVRTEAIKYVSKNWLACVGEEGAS